MSLFALAIILLVVGVVLALVPVPPPGPTIGRVLIAIGGVVLIALLVASLVDVEHVEPALLTP